MAENNYSGKTKKMSLLKQNAFFIPALISSLSGNVSDCFSCVGDS